MHIFNHDAETKFTKNRPDLEPDIWCCSAVIDIQIDFLVESKPCSGNDVSGSCPKHCEIHVCFLGFQNIQYQKLAW